MLEPHVDPVTSDEAAAIGDRLRRVLAGLDEANRTIRLSPR
jgi:hypothetical protein